MLRSHYQTYKSAKLIIQILFMVNKFISQQKPKPILPWIIKHI